ncbi:MAG: conjugal transfer protein TraF [Psychromonas sp.]
MFALSVSAILLAPNVNAANKVADARGNAMGNTGVASSHYLTAPFYNPALGANFKAHDDFAILLPAIGASFDDVDENLTTIDDLQSFMDDFTSSQADIDQLEAYLNELDSNAPLTVTAGLGFAFALPMNTVSVNFFSRAYVEVIASANISNATDIEDRYDQSTVNMLAFGYAEFGFAFSKTFTLSGERVSFGITPKYQRMNTYAQAVSVDDFDLDDYDESEITKDAFNLDLGTVWYKDNFQVGLAVKDLFSQKVDVQPLSGFGSGIDTYKLDTQVTVALAYFSDYFIAAIDADLTKQTRFQGVDDDTQFVRVGIEGNAWGWAQLRAGYEVDLQGTLDNTITAGIGMSPFDVVKLDLAGSYAGENQLGVSASLAFTF